MKKLLIGLLALSSFSALASNDYCKIKYSKAIHEYGFKSFDGVQHELKIDNSYYMTEISVIKDLEGDVLGVFVPEIERTTLGNLPVLRKRMKDKEDFVKTLNFEFKEETHLVKSIIKTFYSQQILSVAIGKTSLELELNQNSKFKLSIPLDKTVSLVCENQNH
jgi:hypothetical protein